MTGNKVQHTESEDKLSKFSRFVRILIALRLIPVTADYENLQASFNTFSMKFVWHIFAAFGPPVIINGITFTACKMEMTMIMEHTMKMFMEDPMTVISQMMDTYFFYFSFPLMMYSVSKGVPSIPGIALARDLQWPKHGSKMIIEILFIISIPMPVNIVLLKDSDKYDSSSSSLFSRSPVMIEIIILERIFVS